MKHIRQLRLVIGKLRKEKKGYSVIEILVVVGVLAILGILASQTVSLSLTSSKKNDSLVDIKQELDRVSGNIERLLQTANVVIIGVNCTTVNATSSVGFKNNKGFRGDIACLDMNTGFYVLNKDKRVASSSSGMAGGGIEYNDRMTSDKIDITSCGFNCYSNGNTTYIDFNIKGQIKGLTGSEGSSYQAAKKILVKSAVKK
jgi:type II secretory pathway pseudopilin PulG